MAEKQTYYSGFDQKLAKAMNIELGLPPKIQDTLQEDFYRACLQNEKLGDQLKVANNRVFRLICGFALVVALMLGLIAVRVVESNPPTSVLDAPAR